MMTYKTNYFVIFFFFKKKIYCFYTKFFPFTKILLNFRYYIASYCISFTNFIEIYSYIYILEISLCSCERMQLNIKIANLFSEINNKYYKANKRKTKNHSRKFRIRNMYYNISFIPFKKKTFSSQNFILI